MAKKSKWQVALEKQQKSKSTDPVFIIDTITPEDAESLLEEDTRNRALRPGLVGIYTEFMAKKKWAINGETIKVSSEGLLIDGQHRLNAILSYGRPVRMALALGVDKNCFLVTDTGRPRSAGDILKIAGYKNCNTNAACANLLLVYQHHEAFTEKKQIPPVTILEAIERWPHVVHFVYPSRAGDFAMPATITQFMMYVTMTIDEEKSYNFFSGVQIGYDLAKNSPLLMLRSYFAKLKAKQLRLDKRHMVASFIIAWNAFYDDVEVETIRWTTGDFPVISGVDRKKLFKRNSGFGKT